MNTDTKAMTPASKSRNGKRDLHVKAIPEPVWMLARCNATRSGLSFKEYLTRILSTCQPISDVDTIVPSG